MLTEKKRLLFEKQAEIVSAMAHPIRIAILDFLKDGERCVCDIAKYVGSERSNVSRHLSVMVKAGVLDCHKKGLWVIYRLRARCIINFLSCATACLKQQVKEGEKLLETL
jgi:ArsR family transcriptional regulator